MQTTIAVLKKFEPVRKAQKREITYNFNLGIKINMFLRGSTNQGSLSVVVSLIHISFLAKKPNKTRKCATKSTWENWSKRPARMFEDSSVCWKVFNRWQTCFLRCVMLCVCVCVCSRAVAKTITMNKPCQWEVRASWLVHAQLSKSTPATFTFLRKGNDLRMLNS